ncbi:ADP-ribosylation family protein [Streptomyces sp. NPDC021212]|uniref:ADP-ribosylation family protein n=1 Tax=Streptomyces sp. NPDC021212 TaxID=3365118 RepID=UPI0037A8B85F
MDKARADVEERVRRDWGLTLPESFFRLMECMERLGPVERRALADMGVSPCGVADVYDDPGARPREGVDVRAHGRYYRDPPEFLTFLHGGSDGLHYGLWSDDGRTCEGIASYYNNDGGGIERHAGTPLEAVRALLERHWRDLADDDGDEEYLAERRSGLGALRQALTGFETGDRAEVGIACSRIHDAAVPPVDPGRITTLDGAGALVAGSTALDRPPHNGADTYAFARYMYEFFEDHAAVERSVEEARRRCAAGDPAEALVLGRDLHWASGGEPVFEGFARDLLAAAYGALDRPALAETAAAHHRHRDLPRVDVLLPSG